MSCHDAKEQRGHQWRYVLSHAPPAAVTDTPQARPFCLLATGNHHGSAETRWVRQDAAIEAYVQKTPTVRPGKDKRRLVFWPLCL